MMQGPGPGLPFGYEHPNDPYGAKKAEDARKGQKLVSMSRWLLLGGCGLMFGGCGSGIALQFAPLAIAGSVLGSVMIVVAAVVGSVGRGMQGRII